MDEEDEGAESDTSNIMPEPPRHRRHNPYIHNDDDDAHDEYDDEEDEEDEDDDYVDDNDNGFPRFFFRQPTTCPCCLPNNNLGYVCPPEVRLEPLPDNTNYQDYVIRRMVQPGHSQCIDCRNHIPLVNDTVPAATANRFQCKLARRFFSVLVLNMPLSPSPGTVLTYSNLPFSLQKARCVLLPTVAARSTVWTTRLRTAPHCTNS